MSAFNLASPAAPRIRFKVSAKGFSILALALAKFSLSLRPVASTAKGFEAFVLASALLGFAFMGLGVTLLGLFLPLITVGFIIAAVVSGSAGLGITATVFAAVTLLAWRIKVTK